MFKNPKVRRISIMVFILLIVALISVGSSSTLIFNATYFDTGRLDEQSHKYDYVADNLVMQIEAATNVFTRLETDTTFVSILMDDHNTNDDVRILYESIDTTTIYETAVEQRLFNDITLYTTNPTAQFDDTMVYLTTDLQAEDWYERISTSRRAQTIFYEDGVLYVLHNVTLTDNPNDYITVGVVQLDLSVLDNISLSPHAVLLTNVALESTHVLSGDKELEHPETEYLSVFETSYLNEEMILQYDIVPGSTLSRWNIMIVSERVEFMTEFLKYAAIVFVVISTISLIIFYRYNFVRDIKKSFDDLSPDNIRDIINSNRPSRIERIIKELYEKVEMLVQQNQELDFINQQKEAQKNEAEIKALLSQINPHYIFNLLNSIHKRALKNNELISAKMILLMSKQLRRSLEWKEPMVTLKEELDHIKSYIELQKYYYGTDCEIFYDIDESLYSLKVPKLIFQTLIENALKHGVKDAPFYIQVTTKENYLSFSVANEVEGNPKDVQDRINRVLISTEEITDNEGIGLRNMKKRLEYYYNDNYHFITHVYKKNISITLMLPKLL